jgi:hypothetical protein
MPPKYHVSKTTKIWTGIFALAIDSAEPNATQTDIRESVENQAPELLKMYGLKPLQESHANKYIREIQTANNRGWLDSPWQTGIFAANDSYQLEISTDQLPTVMTVALRVFAGGKRLTARQAMWVGRLNALKKLDPDESTDGDIEDIYGLAVAYSAREKAATSIARRTNQGKPVMAEENLSDLDTWSLDVLVGLTESPIAPDMQLYEVLLESGYTQDPLWTSKARMDVTPTTKEVKPLHTRLLSASPELIGSCKAMTAALLWIRAYAEQGVEYGTRWVDPEISVDKATARVALSKAKTDEKRHDAIISLMASGPMQLSEPIKAEREWGSLSPDEQREKAREIGGQVLKVIELEKQKAERVQAEQQAETAREIALQVMGLIEQQKETDSDD